MIYFRDYAGMSLLVIQTSILGKRDAWDENRSENLVFSARF